MFKFTVLCSLISLAFATQEVVNNKSRIVGGTVVDIQKHPHQLSLELYGYHTCGAVLIKNNFALTSAHCTNGTSASSLTIRARTSTLGSGGQVVQVKKVNQHPAFDSNYDYDISVLELAQTVTLGSGAQVISIGSEPEEASTVTITGWGRTSESGSPSKSLQAVGVSIISRSDCQDAYGFVAFITDRMICGGVQGGKGSCEGDYGGPVVVGEKLVGITSFSYGCARPRYPSIYSNLGNQNLRNFVKNIAGV